MSASLIRISLILGGARSGKSAYAETLICATPSPWIYCATAQALDDEMRDRIAHHRARRAQGWITLETPLHLAEVIAAATHPILVDYLTLWLTNIMLAGWEVAAESAKLLAAAEASKAPVLFVSNEVGLGIVPDNKLAREFRDHAGRLNQEVAKIASRVVFVAAGLPMVLKAD
jgi:adenosylcobinamide kinase/adenosylcobinamide-phosphate guanylyltransferase